MKTIQVQGPGGRLYDFEVPDDSPDVADVTVVIELVNGTTVIEAREVGQAGTTYSVLPSGALAVYDRRGEVSKVFGPAAWISVQGDERQDSLGAFVSTREA